MLADAGAGRPASYFRRQSIAGWRAALGVAGQQDSACDQRDYLDAVRRAGSAGSAVCGLRLMWESTAELFAVLGRVFPDAGTEPERLVAAFGPVTFLHLSRADRLAQAVSLDLAEGSGIWHRKANGEILERGPATDPRTFDADRIARRIAALAADEAAWQGWFERHGIDPVRIDFDSLADDPAGTLDRVLGALGLDPSAGRDVVPATARLSDGINQDWIRRYRAARGDPDMSTPGRGSACRRRGMR